MDCVANMLPRPRTAVLMMLFSLAFVYMVHKPLPQGFPERVKLSIIETILRLVYFYPSRLFNSASFMLWWTRLALGGATRAMGPYTLRDSQVMIRDEVFDGVPTRVYVPKTENRTSDGAVIFIHGGGFVVGEIKMYEALTRELSKRLGMVLLSIDYRLAPEHLFPAGIEDCERVVVDFLKHSHRLYGVDPTKVVIMGDSAGGNIATVMTHRLRHRDDVPPLKLQVLMYPLLQFYDLHTPSYQNYQSYAGTTFLDPSSVAFYLMMYVGLDMDTNPHFAHAAVRNEHVPARVRQQTHAHADFVSYDRLPHRFTNTSHYRPHVHLAGDEQVYEAIAPFLYDPEFSPLMQQDLSGLPKAFVFTCEHDILRDEGVMYAERLREQGNAVTWHHSENGFHAMFNMFMEIEVARTGLAQIANWVHANIDV